jgi:hypothetical protein
LQFASFGMVSFLGDFHPQDDVHARRTNKKTAPPEGSRAKAASDRRAMTTYCLQLPSHTGIEGLSMEPPFPHSLAVVRHQDTAKRCMQPTPLHNDTSRLTLSTQRHRWRSPFIPRAHRLECSAPKTSPHRDMKGIPSSQFSSIIFRQNHGRCNRRKRHT